MAREIDVLPDAQREAVLALQRIPNVGPKTARDLLRLGVTRADDLIERSPREMFETLCRIDGVRHDPCVLDVFCAVVAYARGEPPRAWWLFTNDRIAAERRTRVPASPAG